MIDFFTTKKQHQVTLGQISTDAEGRPMKKVWSEARSPTNEDIESHLRGDRLLGIIPDRAINLDLDDTPLSDLKPLVSILEELGVQAYIGEGNTRGSKVWFFLEKPLSDMQSLAQDLAHLAKQLLGKKHRVEVYPNGKRSVFLPLFGILGKNGRPLYELNGNRVKWPFDPQYADPEAIRKLGKAAYFLEVALQRRPMGSRHEAAMALLNLAHRAGIAKEVKTLLGTEKVFASWSLGDSRTPDAWLEELNRLLEAAVSGRYEEGVASTEFVPIAPRVDVLSPEYLGAYLRTPHFVDYATANTTGSRQPRTRLDALWSAPSPSPLAEQERIVERLEALQEKLRALGRPRPRQTRP